MMRLIFNFFSSQFLVFAKLILFAMLLLLRTQRMIMILSMCKTVDRSIALNMSDARKITYYVSSKTKVK